MVLKFVLILCICSQWHLLHTFCKDEIANIFFLTKIQFYVSYFL